MSARAHAPRRAFPLLVLLLLACVLAMLGPYLRAHDAANAGATPAADAGAPPAADSGGRVEAYDGYWFGMTYEEAKQVRKDAIPARDFAVINGLPGWLTALESAGVPEALTYPVIVFGRNAQVLIAFSGNPPIVKSVAVSMQTRNEAECLALWDKVDAYYSGGYGQFQSVDPQESGLDSRFAVRGSDGSIVLNALPIVWNTGNGHRAFASYVSYCAESRLGHGVTLLYQ
jgi:hypothetical protein